MSQQWQNVQDWHNSVLSLKGGDNAQQTEMPDCVRLSISCYADAP